MIFQDMVTKKRSAAWFENLLDSAEDFIFVKGPRSRLIWANKRFREFFNITEEEIEQISGTSADEERDHAALSFLRNDVAPLKDGQTLKVRESCQNANNESFALETLKSPIQIDGQIDAVIGVSRFLDENARAGAPKSPAKKIENFTKISSQLISTSPFPIFICDTFEKLVASSAGFQKLIPRDYNKDLFISDLFEDPALSEAVLACIKEGAPKQICPLLVDERTQYNLFVEPWTLNGQVLGAQVSIDDRSEHLRLAKDLEEFVYITSHDLKEPLRMLTSYLALLNEEHRNSLNEEGLVFLDFATQSAERIKILTSALLTYSRINVRPIEKENTDLKAVMENVVLALTPLAEESNDEILVENLPSLYTDPDVLEIILTHLVANALKFVHKDVPPEVSISAKEEARFWRISVKDHGIGIDPKFYSKIFKIFRRLHHERDFPGIGMGLSACKRLVEKLGGSIGVDNIAQGGTEFWFTLPKHS